MRAHRHTGADISPRGSAERDPHAWSPISASRPYPHKASHGAFAHSAQDSLSTFLHSRAAAPTAPLGQVRWSDLRAQTSRPQFSVVTGVSAGALIAPYAFLGSAWDDQLIEVYTSGRAEHLLQSRGLGALFGSSVYSGTPLKALVDRYATDALIQAVAHEASTGRLLLVATTDVKHRRAGRCGT